MFTDKDGKPRIDRIIGASAGVLFLIIVIFGMVGQVNAGERGVKTRFGAVVGTLQQ